ncbi:hypothetical protein [Sandaracinus amylolyticus]|uniref:Lipoprotein n=1 Tax=Sandaracinus amylolyticus TaxID=927083 RepID=A0A0F6W816_9BACT|nr:hypothetical protein [Sandaracinus amylolyticus]AKF09818.1 hypothetical protein DB32_006967 [Sandaracinus amylolyticus]
MTRIVFALSTLALVGCTPFALSPPARTLPLESSATLEEGQASVQIAGSYIDAIDVRGGSGSVRGRVGVASQIELQAEGTIAHLDYGDERSPLLGAGRMGVKFAPIESVGLVAGVGAGGHSYGPFVAPDIGVIFAYENPYVVPWGAARAFVSLPVDPSTVRVTQPDGDTVETFDLTPPSTAGWQLSTGIRIPVVIDAELDRPRRGSRVDIHLGVAYSRLHGLEGGDEIGLYQVEAGVEIVIDPSVGARAPAEL